MTEVLRRIELFQDLSEEEMDALVRNSSIRTLPADTLLFREYDPADALFIIVSGRVKVYCSDNTGRDIVINTQGAGDYFGELALLEQSLRSASVRTIDESCFCVVLKDDFDRLLEQHPGIVRTMLKNLARQIRKLTANVKSLALRDVYGRMAFALRDLAEERGDGTLFIPKRLTQQDIADRIGASSDIVARILKDLTIEEYIRFEGHHIIINTRLPAEY